MKTRIIGWLSIPALIVAVLVYYPYSPAGRQGANMRKAEQHAGILKPRLANDPRFANIRLEAFTAQNGCLLVEGEVSNAADVEALRRIVMQSNPPDEVVYHVRVIQSPAAQTQEN